jgi:hypothetical protein
MPGKTDFDDLYNICTCFGRPIRKLPTSVVVFLVVDGLSFFSTPSGRMEETREVVAHLVNIYRQQSVVTMKFLFTSPTRTRFLEDLFDDDEIFSLPLIPPPPPPGLFMVA